MSDLQCPAILLVLGQAGWPSHVPLPHDANVVAVYCPADAIEVATDLADELDVPLRPIVELNGTQHAEPTEALNDLADLHRGEAVVVLTGWGENVAARRIRIDADGWAVSPLD